MTAPPSTTRMRHLVCATGLAVMLLTSAVAGAGAQPAPPYPAYPPAPRKAPPPPPSYPVVAPPPPLSPLMRVVYAPFYAAGLVVRYGVYYLFVAPLEVFSRTLDYGVEGGVPSHPATAAHPVAPEGGEEEPHP